MANEMLEPLMAKMMGDMHQGASDSFRRIMYIFEDAMIRHREQAAEYQKQYKELMGEKVNHQEL